MRKVLLFVVILLIAVCGIVTGTQYRNTEAAQLDVSALFPGKQVTELDRGNHGMLLLVSDPVLAESSPDYTSGILYRVPNGKNAEIVDDGVVSAKYLKNGDIIYTARGELWRWNGERRSVIEGVESDFAVSSDERDVAVIIYHDDDFDSELLRVGLNEAGSTKLAEGDGRMYWPLFSPDGKWLLFVGAFDGVTSWYRVDLATKEVVQVTNRGLKPGPDVLSDRYIPIPQMTETLVFVDDITIEYETGNGRIQLDIIQGTRR